MALQCLQVVRYMIIPLISSTEIETSGVLDTSVALALYIFRKYIITDATAVSC